MNLKELERRIIRCRKCPRLVKWRSIVAKTKIKRFLNFDYWGKPVPGFGDIKAELLVIGLAPSAHGGNRTGRMFTGDHSGNWLFRTLYKTGFANQPSSKNRHDGLKLNNCYITAACKCAPPQNKPSNSELINCQSYLTEEIISLKNLRVIIGLGKIGFDAIGKCFKKIKVDHDVNHQMRFTHGIKYNLPNNIIAIGSYHPSQQNTFTGRLTEPMFDKIFETAKHILRAK